MPLHILHIEDNSLDAELVRRMLEQDGLACEVALVHTPEDVRLALEQRQFDLILSDYTLPGFGGLSALEAVKQKAPDCPLIFVSGTIGEDAAVEALKRGATDYILKDRLGRLPLAVRRALLEKAQQAQHKRAEQKIIEQAAMLDAAQEAILGGDLEGRIRYWNKGAERVHGWSAEEVLGRKTTEFLYRDLFWFPEAIRLLLLHGQWSGEVVNKTKTGSEVLTQTHWSLVRDANGNPKSILSIHTDITDKKKQDEKFLRAQRLDTVGTLAGGIAHDLNNALAPLLMGIELLRSGLLDDQKQSVLNNMHASAQRGAEMVTQILSFARGVAGESALLDVKRLIKEIERFAKEAFPKSIQIQSDVASRLSPVKANATQLHQVLLNLCVNARDAMPKGGLLRIEASNVTLENRRTPWYPKPVSGLYVAVMVSDTGEGIPPELLDKIFEPFFTTKAKGTGLGLSTVEGIIKAGGGFVEVFSQLGKGTSFKVFLPAFAASLGKPAESEPSALPAGAGETILVVDDEIALLEMVRETLESFNYRVLLARNGAEAVSTFRTHTRRINAVILDMMMPVMDGPSTLVALRKINPSLEIIGVTGLGPEAPLLHGIDASLQAFLAKPFTRDKLLTTLRQVLDRKSEPSGRRPAALTGHHLPRRSQLGGRGKRPGRR